MQIKCVLSADLSISLSLYISHCLFTVCISISSQFPRHSAVIDIDLLPLYANEINYLCKRDSHVDREHTFAFIFTVIAESSGPTTYLAQCCFHKHIYSRKEFMIIAAAGSCICFKTQLSKLFARLNQYAAVAPPAHPAGVFDKYAWPGLGRTGRGEAAKQILRLAAAAAAATAQLSAVNCAHCTASRRKPKRGRERERDGERVR